MTDEQKFLLHELSPPSFPPLPSLSYHFIPVCPKTCCTSTQLPRILFYRHKTCTSIQYSPDTFTTAYTLLLSPRCTTGMHKEPSTPCLLSVSPFHCSQLGKSKLAYLACALLHLHPLVPALVRKKRNNKIKTRGRGSTSIVDWYSFMLLLPIGFIH